MPLFVAETKPKAEVQALTQLKRQGFEAFYPTCRVERTTRGGPVEFIVPLFPRYVFIELELDKQRWRSVNGTYGVRRLLGSDPERPDKVPHDVAVALRQRCAAGPEDDPEEALRALCAGVRVQANCNSALVGSYGEVTRTELRDGERRVIVLMYLLGRLNEVSFRRSEVDRVV